MVRGGECLIDWFSIFALGAVGMALGIVRRLGGAAIASLGGAVWLGVMWAVGYLVYPEQYPLISAELVLHHLPSALALSGSALLGWSLARYRDWLILHGAKVLPVAGTSVGLMSALSGNFIVGVGVLATAVLLSMVVKYL